MRRPFAISNIPSSFTLFRFLFFQFFLLLFLFTVPSFPIFLYLPLFYAPFTVSSSSFHFSHLLFSFSVHFSLFTFFSSFYFSHSLFFFFRFFSPVLLMRFSFFLFAVPHFIFLFPLFSLLFIPVPHFISFFHPFSFIFLPMFPFSLCYSLSSVFQPPHSISSFISSRFSLHYFSSFQSFFFL